MTEKQAEFNRALKQYQENPAYRWFGLLISVANCSLQALLIYQVCNVSLGYSAWFLALVLAYYLTDFINGLVHMYMDNSDRYDGWTGPLYAAFHLHHRTPRYRKRPLPLVYFIETGNKIWLVPFLLISTWLNYRGLVSEFASVLLAMTGVLSSVAEVSHYLCHTSRHGLYKALARAGLLLPMRHHAFHHAEDNKHYAFLNGWSDPVLNLIAARVYPGYKCTTDLHYAHYSGE